MITAIENKLDCFRKCLFIIYLMSIFATIIVILYIWKTPAINQENSLNISGNDKKQSSGQSCRYQSII